ncbi:murein hydrolase activator EnvC [uncultured Veillonella sp.]|uniref:murein hydrolase activator EnvC family protein n=1 Tax=uncultured Veillonella sp. TaxID=159268 RepID=UPI0025E0A906|nr:M23 family metallopeptidase [uncultured Veillonella sp.]MDY3973391.1 peptidoglycan DD-metalloendopeptidase family protein [Veillonella caviae]
MAKNNLKLRIMAVLLSTTVLAATPFSYTGAEDEDLTNQLDAVQQQMNDASAQKANAEATITNVSEQLHQIQIELDQATDNLKTYQDQRVAVEQEIAKNQKLLEEAQARLAKRESVFNKRVRDIYINGRLSYLDVIVGAKDFSDFANRVEMLKRIIDADIKLINSIKTEREEIANRKAVLEEDRAKVVELENKAKEAQAVIQKKKDEQTAILNKAQSDKATAEQLEQSLQESSNAIRAMLQQRQAERAAAAAAAAQSSGGGYSDVGYVQGTGQLSWPVNGVITSDFGWRTHPIFGRQILHSGIDIGVDEGTPVHSADSGVVAYSGWMDGYGYAVVVDHGNGISTLYGHNSDLAVSEGQTVSKGSVIAYAGSTGNSTGPHVHFEVRVNGDPVNPLGYL